ncbi:MAG: hypothetical protein F2618_01525 [Actinobacteria bacterium]|nr:hypothetical protein [Actinomycetota bacterium]
MFSTSVLDVPRPLIDPITSLVEALSVAALALPRPRNNGTIVLCMDQQQRGVHLFRTSYISRTTIHHIVRECCHVSSLHSVVLFSIRSVPPICPNDPFVLENITNTLNAAGLHLHDWVVIGAGGMYCPRSLVDPVDPWRHGSVCL